ncbi:MAG: DgaE family pyridoxal phosphate-dependent ammonia lyase, partial [Chloroflexota bacterium]|nr:DgaE family pyridoxal phosphate-dependent ammonia lyase [Chloroflexota bacterium]
MTIYQDLGLQRIINASGRMTALGVSVAAEETAEALKEASKNFVDVAALIDAAGKRIASYTGGADSCPTAGAAAGIAIAVAGCIARGSLTITQLLPNASGLPNEVIIQKGHSINFGAPVSQMIALGGGIPVEIGFANNTHEDNLREAITDKTAAIFYVKSHHCVQKGMISLEKMVMIGKEAHTPVIVDAAAEEDLRRYIAMGADLVIYSGSKAIEGPVSGFITGDADLIASCKMQYYGIGRTMKIGKEGIIGLLKALELYEQKSVSEVRDREMQKLNLIKTQLQAIEGLTCTIHQDPAGRAIDRLRISIDPDVAGMNIEELIKKLSDGPISIRTRNHLVNLGMLEIDP